MAAVGLLHLPEDFSLAGFSVIADVGKSIESLLAACFAEHNPLQKDPMLVKPTPRVVLATTDDFEKTNVPTKIGSPALSIFLYRVDFNKVMRAAWSAVSLRDGKAHLALDLHYLITPWAGNAEDEHLILGAAMQCLETTPILSGPLLNPSIGWEPGESIQLVLEEISTEAVMRTFDSLPTDYRLSVPYIARVIRLDGRQQATAGPVITAITGVTAEAQP